MKNAFLPDGHWRLMLDKSTQQRKVELWISVRVRHAAELSAAGLLGGMMIRLRMRREFNREWKQVAPSPHALYIGRTSC